MILRNSNRCQKKYFCTLEETKAMGQKRGIKFEKENIKLERKCLLFQKYILLICPDIVVFDFIKLLWLDL